MKNKKVGKTVRNVHCACALCARSAPKIVQNALVLLRNIIGIIKTHIHDNHIEFEVSGRFGGVWPTVRHCHTHLAALMPSARAAQCAAILEYENQAAQNYV